MNRLRFYRLAACLAPALALAALALANGDNFVYDDTDLRDPMVPYVKRIEPKVQPPDGGPPIVDDELVSLKKIKEVIAMCTIDGLAVTRTGKKYACINDRIIRPGDKAIATEQVRIADITEKEIVFELANAKIKYVVTPIATNATMSSDVPTKD